jgi:GT2 family glycosyltransferase
MVVCLFKESESWPSVSVVIVNYNGKELLRKCLLTLLETDYPNYEAIVVDNASTDGSVTENKDVIGSSPKIKLVKNSKNVGHAQGCNIGTKQSSGKYVVFLDSDIEFEEKNWLTELVNVMETDKTVGLAQAKILLAQDKTRLEYVCTSVDALGSWTANYGQKEKLLTEKMEILAASSGCSIIRREVFEQVGGFDPDYFIYDDDTDLSVRVRLVGYLVLFVPSSVVIHRGGVMRGVSGRMLFHSSKNRFYTVLKNYELKNVWWRFSVLTFFTLLVSAGFFVTKKHQEAKATLRGIINPLVVLPKIWRKRLRFQAKRRVKDSELVKGGFVRNDFQSTLQDFKLKLKNM